MKLFISQELKLSIEASITKRIKKFLDSTQDGELFTIVQLMGVMQCSESAIMKSQPFMVGYFHTHAHKKYFGKVATIKQLKKEIEKNAKR